MYRLDHAQMPSMQIHSSQVLLQEIIVGRPRDGSDRVTWLLEHSRFEQALDIIESDVTLSQATREQVS